MAGISGRNNGRSNEILGWGGVNCFAFLKCKLTVVLTDNLKFIPKRKIFLFFSFFAMSYVKNRITNDSYSRTKYLKARFAKNKRGQSCPD
jgi:hypothetical protein